MPRLLLPSLVLLLASACSQAAEPVAEAPVRHAAIASAAPAATDLGTLGGNSSFAADINDPGAVVGYSETASGLAHAFRWTAAGGMTDLGTLPSGNQSGAIRILNSGKILGWSETDGGKHVPVQWSASGQIQALDIPPLREVFYMSPSDFNERGEVVGGAVGEDEHGWYWSRRTGTIDLRNEIPSCLENYAAAINASGLVAGTYCYSYLHPFTWRFGDKYVDLGVGEDVGNGNGVSYAINNAGTVAGYLNLHSNVGSNAAIWLKGMGYTLLPDLRPEFPNGVGLGINNRGVVVGGSVDGDDDGFTPVAWPTPSTLVRLNTDGLQWALATAINDRGLIVGWGMSSAGNIRALLWKLSDGKPVTALSPGGAAIVAGEAPTRITQSGPASCLADRHALASKAALASCVMLRR